MPTYDYKCDDCGYHFERFQSITAAPLTDCPKCYAHVKRLIGAGNGFLFKGNGFYVTDYRSSGYKTDKQNAEGTGSKTNGPTASAGPEKDIGSKTMAQNAVKKAE